MNESKSARYYPWILVLLGSVAYTLFLGSVHLFDWDEINFAESSREMIVSGDYFRVMIDYKPFWEKPPFFFWLQVISMKVFGMNEFAARFPNSLVGVLTLLTIYRIGTFLRNKSFGFLWALTYFCSFLPFLYFKSGIIDPVFNYFIFLSIYFLIRSINAAEQSQKTKFSVLAGVVNGLAVLTKGPVGLLLFLLTFFISWASFRFRNMIRWKDIFLFAGGFIVASCIWYVPELITNGPGFFEKFVRYQVELFSEAVAGHEQPFFYHFLVVFVGCFPMSVWALPALFSSRYSDDKIQYRRWMIVLFWVVLVLFSIVRTKIVHYSSMTYLPLSYLAATVIYHAIENRQNIKKWTMGILVGMSCVFSCLMCLVPFFFYHKEKFFPYIRDPFAVDSLRQPIVWNGREWVFGIIFLLGTTAMLILFRRKKIFTGVMVYALAFVITITAYLKMVIPRVEKYTQGPAIGFYEALRGQDVYVNIVGFKSYAHFFYFQQPLYPDHKKQTNVDWQIDGPVDKPAYFVTKTTEKYLGSYPNVKEVERKGGFILYRREKQNAP